MSDERQILELPANQVSAKWGFPLYRTNPAARLLPAVFLLNSCSRGRNTGTGSSMDNRLSFF
jgi:hypothetical protein